MSKKYEILKDDFITLGDIKLFRIRALKDFGNVKAGDLGGFIQSEENLAQYGPSWVYNDAKVFDNARVEGLARIYHNAQVCGDEIMVYDITWIKDNAL